MRSTGAIRLATPVDVLFIDDDAPLRNAVCDVLRGEGFSVGEAADGAEALAYIESGHLPSLVFLDLDMPVMNGREFLVRFKNSPETANIPVVIVSGLIRSGVVAGPDGVMLQLAKPISPEYLVGYVRRFVKRGAARMC